MVSNSRNSEELGDHVDASTVQKFRELAFDRDERRPGMWSGRNSTKDIHVAVGSEVVSQHVPNSARRAMWCRWQTPNGLPIDQQMWTHRHAMASMTGRNRDWPLSLRRDIT